MKWSLYSIYRDKCADDGLRTYLNGVVDGFSQILSNVFNCNRFSAELLTNTRTQHIRVSLEVMKLLLVNSQHSSDCYLNPENIHKNIFHHMISVCIPKGKIWNVNSFLVDCLLKIDHLVIWEKNTFYRNDSNLHIG